MMPSKKFCALFHYGISLKLPRHAAGCAARAGAFHTLAALRIFVCSAYGNACRNYVGLPLIYLKMWFLIIYKALKGLLYVPG
jgi:hypothetical protein